MQASTEQLLKAIEQLPQQELDAFVEQVLKLRAQRQVPHLPQPESELLLKINYSLPTSSRTRFDELIAKRQELTITDAELIEITDASEQLNAERIAAIAELAKLRHQTLDQIMQDLGIHPPACV